MYTQSNVRTTESSVRTMDEGCGEVLPIQGQRRYAMKMTPSCYLDCSRHDRDYEYDDDDDDNGIDNTDS